MSTKARINELLLHWKKLRNQGQTLSAEELCQGYPDLLPEIRRQLDTWRAHFQKGQAAAAGLSLRATLPPAESVQATRTLGSVAPSPADAPAVPGYEILGELGRGGMGVVYKARQVRANRLVALKMILAGAQAGPDQLERFRKEAEAVARLRHPHIVQVYEVGETAGKPFFSLEMIEGGSLSGRLGGKPLPPAQAAQLIEALARAMAAAHGEGIIHRDLKPANVLLAADGTPKITDFGLAKRVNESVGQTASGAVLGTPSYMPPEQALGKTREMGPAVDIYALGAVLYEVLTGRPPFVADTVLNTLYMVVSDEPVPVRQLQSKVPRDLETICLKCLQKDPGKRYATAGALADDLRSFTEGRPIAARPVGKRERLWRWCRRNPGVAGLSAALLLVLVGGLLAVTTFWLEAAEQRDQAEMQRDAAAKARDQAKANLELANANFALAKKAVDDCFLIATKDPLFQEENMRPARKLLLEKALPFYEGFRAQRQGDEGLQAGLADNYERVGIITAEIGRGEDALKAYEKAREIHQGLAARHPESAPYQNTLANTYSNLGVEHSTLGQNEEARKAFAKAQEIQERLAARHPEVVLYQSNLADIYHKMGSFHHNLGQSAPARKAFDKAIAIREQLVAGHPKVAQFQNDLAATYNNLGLLDRDLGRRPDALKWFEKAGKICQELAARFPEVSLYQDHLASNYTHLGLVNQELGHAAASRKAFEKGVEIQGRLAARHPEVSQYQVGLASVYNNLALLHRHLGQHAEALKAFNQAREVWEPLATRHPEIPHYQNSLAATVMNVGLTHQALGHGAEAVKAYAKARALREPLVARFPEVPQFQADLANVYYNLGFLHQNLNQFAPAQEAYDKARKLFEPLMARYPEVPQFQSDLADTFSGLATVCLGLGKDADARKALEKAREMMERLVARYPQEDEYRVNLGGLYEYLARVSHPRGKPKESLAWYGKSIAILKPVVQKQPGYDRARALLQKSYLNRAFLLNKLGRKAEAVQDLNEVARLAGKK